MADAQTAANAPGYLPLAGGSLSGQLNVNAGGSGNYNEGIRINMANNGWTSLSLGAAAGSTSGMVANSGQWWIGAGISASNNLLISDESSSAGTGFVLYGNGNAPTWKGATMLTSSNVGSYTAGSAITVGSGLKIMPNYGNEINFSGGGASNSIHFGHRDTGTKPTAYLFKNGAAGYAPLYAANIYSNNSQVITTANIGSYATGGVPGTYGSFTTMQWPVENRTWTCPGDSSQLYLVVYRIQDTRYNSDTTSAYIGPGGGFSCSYSWQGGGGGDGSSSITCSGSWVRLK